MNGIKQFDEILYVFKLFIHYILDTAILATKIILS